MDMYYKILWKESNTCSISKLKSNCFPLDGCVVKRQRLIENIYTNFIDLLFITVFTQLTLFLRLLF